MSFASFPYLVFLSIIFVLYAYVFPQKKKHYLLLFASYIFYSFFGLGFAALMLVTSFITFWTSKKSYNATSKKNSIVFLVAGLTFDVLILVCFKYFHIINLDIMNWPNWSYQQVLVPIGISFYTFKTIGYCVDVYKRKYAPESSFIFYALSVSFFPQLIAGPIEKSITLSNQFKKSFKIDQQNVIHGMQLILWGLFKKIVIADSIAYIINPCYAQIDQYNSLDLLLLSFAFVYQIYTDFSGYTDIAIGSAKLFNIHLPANFYKPYFSKSIGEFWIRWHITFSKWLKEYIFDNMGGISRTNKLITIFNLWVLFLLVGLWHGGTLNYILYAQLAFIWMLADIGSRTWRKKTFKKIRIKKGSLSMKCINYFAIIAMFISLSFFFRPTNMEDSIYIIKNLFRTPNFVLGLKSSLSILLIIGVFEIFQYFQSEPTGTCMDKIKLFKYRLPVYLIMIFSLIFLSLRAEVTFQYYQF